MKGAPECIRISGFMHGVNNPELTKRLNEHIPKTIEEMMRVTTAFIRGKTATASKKKGHAPWKPQDQPKRHASEWKSDFRGQSREGRVSSRFTPLIRTPKEILAAMAGKFKPPPPMVTPVEKRSSNKFATSTMIKDTTQTNVEIKQRLERKKPRPKKSPWQSIWYNRGIELQAKLKMPKYYNARVRGVTFRPGDFVYRSNETSHAMDGGKLGPKWEGPYEVTEALRDVQAKVHRRRGLSADMENRQSQEILSLSYGMDKFVS
ncbi:hypothetical protein Tco_1102571 [Tanacetum coccineum]